MLPQEDLPKMIIAFVPIPVCEKKRQKRKQKRKDKKITVGKTSLRVRYWTNGKPSMHDKANDMRTKDMRANDMRAKDMRAKDMRTTSRARA